MRIIGACVLLWLAGCQLEPDLQRCGNLVCPADAVCTEQNTCISAEDVRACSAAADGDPCSTRKVETGICGGGACVTPGCGNGVVETSEMCDDGNVERDDGCAADCRSDERCGNGVLDFVEVCDDGNHVSNDGCSSACNVEHLELTFAERPGPWDSSVQGATYASAWQTLVLFNLGRTWLYTNGAWTRGPDGPPLYETAIAYDALRQQVVLHGGRRGTDSFGSSETWVFDGTVWASVPGAGGPQRLAHSLAYDPVRQKVVLYGGIASYQSSSSPYSDAWELDDATWALITTTGGPPPGRYRSTMTFDAGRQALVVIAGTSNTGAPRTDMWQLAGTTWSELAATGMPGGYSPTLSYDTARSRLVLTSGTTVWETQTTTWTARTDTLLASDYESWASAYDSVRQRTVLYGGKEGQHWEVGANVTRNAFRPGELRYGRAVFDPSARRLIVHGGEYAETWQRATDGAWSLIAASTVPQPATRSAFVYDPVRRRIVAFGDAGTEVKTWILEGATWMPVITAQPPRREKTTLVYDRAHERIVMFGGADPVTAQPLGDTWAFANDSWTELTTSTSPEPRESPPLAYDAVRERVVLAGGTIDAFPISDTWELDGDRWAETEPMPVRRGEGVLTYDQARRRCVLLGGWENDAGGDEDVLEFDGATWAYVLSTPSPEFETGTGVDYDVTYDPYAHALLALGVEGPSDPWAIGFFTWTDGSPVESCSGGDDLDSDGLMGCADPDCFGYCDPTCPPSASCAAARARCGDGSCDAALETHARCAEDCP